MLEINPLAILKSQYVRRMLPHFTKVKLDNTFFFDDFFDLESWIFSNCKGRFSISKIPGADQEGKIKVFTFVGFEEEKELTYFMLACPFFRR
jgi:hypothetical protein